VGEKVADPMEVEERTDLDQKGTMASWQDHELQGHSLKFLRPGHICHRPSARDSWV
jgi:hypothetical protein